MVSFERIHRQLQERAKGRAADDAVWLAWGGARTAELWKAVVLMCAIDPDSLTLPKARKLAFVEWRLELAMSRLENGVLRPVIRFPEEPRRSIVRFDHLREWCQLNLIQLPERYPVGGEPIDLRLTGGMIPEPKIQTPSEATTVAPVALPKDRTPRAKARIATEYMRELEILAMFPISRATLWRRVKASEFPQPIKLGGNLTAWKRSDVLKWSESAEASSKGQASKTRARGKGIGARAP